MSANGCLYQLWFPFASYLFIRASVICSFLFCLSVWPVVAAIHRFPLGFVANLARAWLVHRHGPLTILGTEWWR